MISWMNRARSHPPAARRPRTRRSRPLRGDGERTAAADDATAPTNPAPTRGAMNKPETQARPTSRRGRAPPAQRRCRTPRGTSQQHIHRRRAATAPVKRTPHLSGVVGPNPVSTPASSPTARFAPQPCAAPGAPRAADQRTSYIPAHDRRHYYTQVERPARGGGPGPGWWVQTAGTCRSAPERRVPGPVVKLCRCGSSATKPFCGRFSQAGRVFRRPGRSHDLSLPYL